MTAYVPLPVPCAGCDEPTPYRVGTGPGDGSFGEWLATPLGDCFHRTHWDRECVRISRRRVNGRHIEERVAPHETPQGRLLSTDQPEELRYDHHASTHA